MNGPARAASTTLLLAVLTLTLAGGEEVRDPPSLLGPVSREEIEDAEPTWVTAEAESDLDLEAARALAAVEPGGDITVYFGTWCSDSRRELARFWRALDENPPT